MLSTNPPLANAEDVQIPICAPNADEALNVIRKYYDQWKQPQV